MRLYLQVVSKDRYYLGDNADFIFDRRGGFIGRAPDADWIIEDSSRFMSGLHLRIDHEKGQFFVTDQSKNGTLRNNHRLQPGVRQLRPLEPGEELSLGQIKIRVVAVQASPGNTTPMGNTLTGNAPPKVDDTYVRVELNSYENEDENDAKAPDAETGYDSMRQHQARLADVIANSFPDVDHGEDLQLSKFAEFGRSTPEPEPEHFEEQSLPDGPFAKTDKVSAPGLSLKELYQHTRSTLPDSSFIWSKPDQKKIQAEQVQDEILTLLLIEVQQQLVRDRISSPRRNQTLPLDNIFRNAQSVAQILESIENIKQLKRHTQAALHYLLNANSDEGDDE